ncbi:MAG: hypothetical protein ACPLVI_00730 [Thermoplasmata archaeon]|jgi:hypothetical protein|nr:hypothetical protein [Thermoplasmatales archaeon]
MRIFILLFMTQMLIFGTLNMDIANGSNVSINQSFTNATQDLKNMLSRLTFVVNSIAISVLSIMWIWEGVFLFLHKDDREGILKFKHDLPTMLIASVIILGASIIVNIIGYIAHG